ncbi:MAG TPA: Xaa-Pro peptidase family protein [Gemmataceae bacterium]|jgi:Xaa-Pro aminopeptidase|nr:Xaa-Pro peptidase family protein [Gemmataceae bacterium]
MDYAADRRQRLAQRIEQDSLDALLVSHPVNVTYLTGFSGDSSYLILTPARALLVSDGRFTEQIAEECPGLEAHIRPPAQTIQQALAEVTGMLGLRTVEFESTHVTVADWETLRELAPAVSWKGGRERVEALRVIKDPLEVAQIREAIEIAERAFGMFRSILRAADREKDLADSLELYIRRAGGRGSSFPSIIAVGERAALPHAPPTDRCLGGAELVLVDWGASGRFYKSDLTRVLAARKISPKLERVYGVVLKAQDRAIRAIRPGAKACDIDAEARAVIAEAGFGHFFSHGLGHGLGLQVHEAPALRQNSDTVLQAGMVTTVEPGIYLPGWGGVRIEDDVLVTPDGHEVLTHVPKDPIPVLDF